MARSYTTSAGLTFHGIHPMGEDPTDAPTHLAIVGFDAEFTYPEVWELDAPENAQQVRDLYHAEWRANVEVVVYQRLAQ